MRIRFVIGAVVVAWLITSGAVTTVTIWQTRTAADKARDANRAEAVARWEMIRSQLPMNEVIATSLTWDCATFSVGTVHIMDSPTGWEKTCTWQATIVTRERILTEEEANHIISGVTAWQSDQLCRPDNPTCVLHDAPETEVIDSTGWPVEEGKVILTGWTLHEWTARLNCPPLLLCRHR